VFEGEVLVLMKKRITLCKAYPHLRRDLGMEHFSPRELYGGNLEGGLLYWGTRKIC